MTVAGAKHKAPVPRVLNDGSRHLVELSRSSGTWKCHPWGYCVRHLATRGTLVIEAILHQVSRRITYNWQSATRTY